MFPNTHTSDVRSASFVIKLKIACVIFTTLMEVDNDLRVRKQRLGLVGDDKERKSGSWRHLGATVDLLQLDNS